MNTMLLQIQNILIFIKFVNELLRIIFSEPHSSTHDSDVEQFLLRNFFSYDSDYALFHKEASSRPSSKSSLFSDFQLSDCSTRSSLRPMKHLTQA